MLTAQQVSQYETFGVVILRGLLSAEELKTLRAEFDHMDGVADGYEPFDGSEWRTFSMLGDDTPFAASLPEDPRFLGPAEQLCGDDVIAYLLNGHRYVGNTPWHYNDGSPVGPYAYGPKYQFPLQPVKADSGALRFIPGSHKLTWQEDLARFEPLGQRWFKTQAAMDYIDQVPSYVCEAEPGDAVLFDKRIFHATWGSPTDRHVFAMTYYHYPETPEETEVMRLIAADFLGDGRFDSHPWNVQPWKDWTANAKGTRKRQDWMDRFSRLAGLQEGETGLRVVQGDDGFGRLVPA